MDGKRMGVLIRVPRGGSWYDNPWYLCSATRNANRPVVRNLIDGFRIVEDLPPRGCVLRGGSCVIIQGFIRSPFRLCHRPELRITFQGFRVAEDLR